MYKLLSWLLIPSLGLIIFLFGTSLTQEHDKLEGSWKVEVMEPSDSTEEFTIHDAMLTYYVSKLTWTFKQNRIILESGEKTGVGSYQVESDKLLITVDWVRIRVSDSIGIQSNDGEKRITVSPGDSDWLDWTMTNQKLHYTVESFGDDGDSMVLITEDKKSRLSFSRVQ